MNGQPQTQVTKPGRTCHIRRNDEVDLTWCGEMTEFTADINDTTPVAIIGRPGDVAVYDDVKYPHGTHLCNACRDAYDAGLPVY